jgi:hypothetical protein
MHYNEYGNSSQGQRLEYYLQCSMHLSGSDVSVLHERYEERFFEGVIV